MKLEAIVTVHDRDLIAQCETSRQFSDHFEKYAYLYVGHRPLEPAIALEDRVRLVHAASFTPNFEHLPDFYDFTGWWTMAHHLLFDSDYIITMQYDMFVGVPDIVERVTAMLDEAPGPIAFTSGHYDAGNFYLAIPGFQDTYDTALRARGVEPRSWPRFNEWPTTQGMAWRTDDFVNFMRWFRPFFDLFHGQTYAGHLAERTVKAWCVVRGTPERYLFGAIRHEARDCHGTGALMVGNRALHAQRAASFGR